MKIKWEDQILSHVSCELWVVTCERWWMFFLLTFPLWLSYYCSSFFNSQRKKRKSSYFYATLFEKISFVFRFDPFFFLLGKSLYFSFLHLIQSFYFYCSVSKRVLSSSDPKFFSVASNVDRLCSISVSDPNLHKTKKNPWSAISQRFLLYSSF